MIYVMSDIHGQYEAFLKMLETIKFTENDTLYILGDIFDRGPDSFKLFEILNNSKNIYHIMGNHDDMFFNTFFNKNHFIRFLYKQLWLLKTNGGKDTYNKFLSIRDRDIYYNYFKNLPSYIKIEVENKKYLLIHAGINNNFLLKNKIKRPFDLWIRKSFIKNIKNNINLDYSVVFGHTPVKRILKYDKFSDATIERCEKYKIFYGYNAIGIDCGAGLNKNLACLCLNNMKEFYVPIVNKKGVYIFE